jgi:hypothetical protein
MRSEIRSGSARYFLQVPKVPTGARFIDPSGTDAGGAPRGAPGSGRVPKVPTGAQPPVGEWAPFWAPSWAPPSGTADAPRRSAAIRRAAPARGASGPAPAPLPSRGEEGGVPPGFGKPPCTPLAPPTLSTRGTGSAFSADASVRNVGSVRELRRPAAAGGPQRATGAPTRPGSARSGPSVGSLAPSIGRATGRQRARDVASLVACPGRSEIAA